jgi:hypothetical protein
MVSAMTADCRTSGFQAFHGLLIKDLIHDAARLAKSPGPAV